MTYQTETHNTMTRLTPEQYKSLTPEQKDEYKRSLGIKVKVGHSSKSLRKFEIRESLKNTEMGLNDYKVMFMASKWNQNSLWLQAEKELPSSTSDFINSVCNQFLSGKQLSEKQAYCLAKEKMNQI